MVVVENAFVEAKKDITFYCVSQMDDVLMVNSLISWKFFCWNIA